ncbi:MAG TPA: cytochrome c [Blastocatellia bacterium]|nr:cytochrome c [Blastocatellia bacterium]
MIKRHLARGISAALILAGIAFVNARGDRPTRALTYSKDIAPILGKNCISCHRPGEAAPMSLLSYKEVRPWARSIREMVAGRRMPPWFADPHYGDFANDSRLSQKDVDTIAAWVDAGSVEGNPADLPPPPKFLEGWNIGTPDVVLTMPGKYHVPAEGVIPYKFFIVPTNFKEDRYVQLAEIRAGNRALVHHVIVDVLYPDKDGKVPPPGEISAAKLEGSGRLRTGDNDGRLVGWAPGEAPLTLKPGQAKLIKAGSVLVFQVHYTAKGTAGEDQSRVGLIFARGPVSKRVITSGAFSGALAIPPGDPDYEVVSSFVFKEDSHIESLHPHMHFRGKNFRYRLIYPDGSSKILLSVPHWDFNWQQTYFLKEPIAAPKRSRLECVAHYDNSINNKFNPDPTKLVRWGPQTWDEMMIGYVDFTLDGQDLKIQPASR